MESNQYYQYGICVRFQLSDSFITYVKKKSFYWTITSDDYEDKKIKAKVKWNQINLISMESVLGFTWRIPLLHMSRRNFFIEVTNERINEFLLLICVIHIYT